MHGWDLSDHVTFMVKSVLEVWSNYYLNATLKKIAAITDPPLV